MTVSELRALLDGMPGDAPVLVGPSRSGDARCGGFARVEVVTARRDGDGWFVLTYSKFATLDAGPTPTVAVLVRDVEPPAGER